MVKHEIEDVGFEVFDMPCMTFSAISQGSSCYICLALFRSSKTSHVKKTHRQVVGHASWASVVAAVALPLWSQPWFIDGRKQISEEDFDGCSWCHDVRFFCKNLYLEFSWFLYGSLSFLYILVPSTFLHASKHRSSFDQGQFLLSAQHGCGFWAMLNDTSMVSSQTIKMDLWTMNPYESLWIHVFMGVFYGPSYCHCAFSTKVYSLHLARSPRRPRWDAERAFTPVKHNLREFNKCFFMVWKCCLQCFLWHKLKSCTTVGSLPGEPNCHMLDEEWRGQHVSCKVFSTIYRDVSTFGNYQASIIIHSCF